MKVCRLCNRTFPLDAFYRHPSTKDRLHTWCKNCCRASANNGYKKKGGPRPGRPKAAPVEAIQ